MQKPRTAIIGAGIAGLSAARHLIDHGVDVTVYEANQRPGGRMHSAADVWTDQEVVTEWCGELLGSDHDVLLSYCRRFGLELIDRDTIEDPTPPVLLIDGELYPYSEAVDDFNHIRGLLKEQRESLQFPPRHDSHTDAAAAIDNMSVSEWIDGHVPGGLQSRLGKLLETTYTIEFGCEARDQSAINIIEQLGGQRSDESFDVLGWSTERYKVRGGVNRIPIELAKSLPPDRVQYRSQVVAIAQTPHAATITYASATGEQVSVEYDEVLIAIPFSTLRHVDYVAAGFDAVKTRAIRELGYGSNTKLQVEFTGRPWVDGYPKTLDGYVFSNANFQAAWESTFAVPSDTAVLVAYQGGDLGIQAHLDEPYVVLPEHPRDVRVTSFLSDLEKLWPGITELHTGRATMSSPLSNPYAKGSYACRLTGQYTGFFGAEGAPCGRFHFAGEHCTGRHHMEFAARSGLEAATAMLAKRDTAAPSTV